MNAKAITLILSAALTLITALPAQSITRLCANPITGEMQAKTKCKAPDITLNAANIWEVLKGKNTYLSACRTVEASDVADPSTAGASITCAPNEFMLNYGDYTKPIALNVVRQNTIQYDGNIPIGVTIIAQNDFGVPNYSFTTGWTFYVTGTCCPRL